MAIVKNIYSWPSTTPWAASAADTAGPCYFIHNQLTTWMAAVPSMASWLTITRSPFQCTTFASTTEVSWLFGFPEAPNGYFRWNTRAGNATTTGNSNTGIHWWGWTPSTTNNGTGTVTTTLAGTTSSNGVIPVPTTTTNTGISVIYDDSATLPWFAVVSWQNNAPQAFTMQVIARLDTTSASLGTGVSWPSQAAPWGFYNYGGGGTAFEAAVPAISNAAPGYGTSITGFSNFTRQGHLIVPGVSGILVKPNPAWCDSHPMGMPNPDLFRFSLYAFGAAGETLQVGSKYYTKIATTSGGLWLRTT